MNSEELKNLEKNLWEAATALRSDSGLKSNEYTTPILGIVFLRFAETVYAKALPAIEKTFAEAQANRSIKAKATIQEIAIDICGFYLPDIARYDYLLKGEYKSKNMNARDALMEAMRETEKANKNQELANGGGLEGSLPINEYNKITSPVIEDLIKKFSEIPTDAGADIFGHIYEYFLDAGSGKKCMIGNVSKYMLIFKFHYFNSK